MASALALASRGRLTYPPVSRGRFRARRVHAVRSVPGPATPALRSGDAMNVDVLMTREPKSCLASDTLHRAAQIMWDEDCGVVPVVDEQGHLVGLVTDRDVCMATYTRGRPPHEIAVGDVMARTLFTLRAEETADAALALVSERRVRRAPVVDDGGRLVGILSIADLVHASLHGPGARRPGTDRVMEAVHAVTKPRRAVVPSEPPSDVLVPAGSSRKSTPRGTRAKDKAKKN